MDLKKSILSFWIIFLILFNNCSGPRQFTQSQWLKLPGGKNIPSEVTAEFDDDIIYIYSDSVDSFVIDFNCPIFEDVDGNITVKLNNHTTYIGDIPPSKKLFIYNKVVIAVDIEDSTKVTFKREAPSMKKSRQLEKGKACLAPTNNITKTIEETKPETGKACLAPTTVMEIKSSTEPKTFIPGKEQIKIKFDNIDNKDITKWEMPIELPDKSVFKEFKGEDNFQNEIIWSSSSEWYGLHVSTILPG